MVSAREESDVLLANIRTDAAQHTFKAYVATASEQPLNQALARVTGELDPLLVEALVSQFIQ